MAATSPARVTNVAADPARAPSGATQAMTGTSLARIALMMRSMLVSSPPGESMTMSAAAVAVLGRDAQRLLDVRGVDLVDDAASARSARRRRPSARDRRGEPDDPQRQAQRGERTTHHGSSISARASGRPLSDQALGRDRARRRRAATRSRADPTLAGHLVRLHEAADELVVLADRRRPTVGLDAEDDAEVDRADRVACRRSAGRPARTPAPSRRRAPRPTRAAGRP